MLVNQFYHTSSDQIRQLCPKASKTLIHNFTRLLIGIYLSGKMLPTNCAWFPPIDRAGGLLCNPLWQFPHPFGQLDSDLL